MSEEKTITITLPKGDRDTIETVESRPIPGHPPGVYDLLVNGKPGLLMFDLSKFKHSEEDERRLISALKESLWKQHRKSLTRVIE